MRLLRRSSRFAHAVMTQRVRLIIIITSMTMMLIISISNVAVTVSIIIAWRTMAVSRYVVSQHDTSMCSCHGHARILMRRRYHATLMSLHKRVVCFAS